MADRTKEGPPLVDRHDVLADHTLLDRVLRERELFLDAIEANPVPFVVYDENDVLMAWNAAYEELHPQAFASSGEAIEARMFTYRDLMRFRVDQSLPPDEIERRLDDVLEARNNGGREAELREHFRIFRYTLPSGGIAGVALDISDLIAAQEELRESKTAIERYAFYDDLTGLANRRMLAQEIETLAASDSPDDAECVLLHIDLDWFKEVNDLLGHAAGDHVLCEVAAMLNRLARSEDLVVRLGGDEFLVLLVGTREVDFGLAMARQIMAELRHPFYFNESPCRVTASIGVVDFNAADDSFETVLASADAATYGAKASGRNQIAEFDAAMRQELRRSSHRHSQLREAIEQGEFIAVYQPQFRADDLQISGIEALCRWVHPNGTLLAPGDFMTAAKKHSLVGAIDQQVFDAVSRDLEWFGEQGLWFPKVSLNVSYERLMDPNLVGDLLAIQRDGQRVAIELLEVLSLDELDDAVAETLDLLDAAGIHVEIDDFGSGRASIASVLAVSPNAIKIDQALVRGAVESAKQRKLIESIIDIGRALDIKVIAEGVETDAHVDLLRSLGCHYLQGFALAKPLTREDLATWRLQGGERPMAA